MQFPNMSQTCANLGNYLSCERMAEDQTVFFDALSRSMLLFLLQTALAHQQPANN